MSREGFGVPEIKQKIKNIRSTYNQEVQKVKKSYRSGGCPDDLYIPTVKWFDIMDQIMKGAKDPGETVSNLGSQVDSKPNTEDNSAEESQNYGEQSQQESQNLAEQRPQNLAGHRSKNLVEQRSQNLAGQRSQNLAGQRSQNLTEQRSQNLVEQRSQNLAEQQPPIRLTSEKSRGTKRRLQHLSEAVNELRTMNQVLTQGEPTLSENEAFGRYVALDKLPQRQAILAQNDIQNVLTRYRLDTVPTPFPSPTIHTAPNQSYNTSPHLSLNSEPQSTSTVFSPQYVEEQELGETTHILSEAWKHANVDLQ